MRASSDQHDPGYRNFAYGKWEVFLDNRLVKNCVTADEELGLVVVLRVDDAGNPYINPAKHEVERLVFHGEVKIREKKPE